MPYFPTIPWKLISPFLAILAYWDYPNGKKFGGNNDGPAQSRKTKEGEAQPKTAGIL
jgi:hypothetical protein